MTLEAELVEALRPVVLRRLQQGRDGSAILRSAAGAALFDLAASGALEGVPLPVELRPTSPLVRIHDLRHEAPAAIPRSRIVRGATVLRDPATVVGVTLHQAAVRDFGPGPADLRRAGGDRTLASVYRAARTAPAHAVALRSGDAVFGRPLRAYLHHAGELNGPSLGLEVEGLYSGVLDDPTTIPDEARLSTWRRETPDPLDELTVETARAALRGLVERGRAEGMPLRWVWAHRQSSGSRASDPGEGLWRALMPVARELGLEAQPERTWDDGRPLPAAWGGSGPY